MVVVVVVVVADSTPLLRPVARVGLPAFVADVAAGGEPLLTASDSPGTDNVFFPVRLFGVGVVAAAAAVADSTIDNQLTR